MSADLMPPIPPDVEQEGEVKPERSGRVTWASAIAPEPVVWAWVDGDAGRIPAGTLAIAAGREGTGKSSFGIWLASHVTRGTLPGAFFGQPKKVLFVAVEDSWAHTLVPRMLAAGADLDRIGRFDVVTDEGDDVTLTLPADNDLLETAIRENDVALVVIDPLLSTIGSQIDTHREHDVRSVLDRLAKLADRTGVVLLGIAHFNKSSNGDISSLITGSGAFKNVPRSVFGFARDTADESGGRVMTQAKNSLGRDDLPNLAYRIEAASIDTATGVALTGKFVFTGETDRSVTDILRDSRAGADDGNERREASGWLVEFLSSHGGECPANDVFGAGRAEGFTRDVLKRAKGRAVESVKVPGGWLWRLTTADVFSPEPVKGASRAQGSRDQKPAPLLPCLLPCDEQNVPKTEPMPPDLQEQDGGGVETCPNSNCGLFGECVAPDNCQGAS